MSAHDHQFTLGIEEEFQIIDPETRELRSHVEKILEDGKVLLKENVKAEMHQSVIELGTDICSRRRSTPGSRWSICAATSPLWRRAGD